VGLFGKSRFLDADVEDWTLEAWAWLMTNLGGMERLRHARLGTATKDYFPPTETAGHARALYVFDRVKALMGMPEWICDLEPFDRLAPDQRVGYYAKLQRGDSANGTFRIEDGKVVISYASDLTEQPRQLIKTFAHELSHYLIATVRKPLPGGNELHELLTELTVAYNGFGLFGANVAFSFEQHQDSFGQGWRTSGSGYFSEPTWAFAIALFTAMTGHEVPRGQLKDSVAVLTRRASRYLQRNPALIEPLRAIR
jgi:hypothetical protein